MDGDIVQIEGEVSSADDAEPGQLMVSLDGVPVAAPYWVVAVGDEDGVSLVVHFFPPMVIVIFHDFVVDAMIPLPAPYHDRFPFPFSRLSLV